PGNKLQIPNSKPQRSTRSQTPNTKLRTPEKLQAPSSKLEARAAVWSLELGISLVFGAWFLEFRFGTCLELGVWCLGFRSAVAQKLKCGPIPRRDPAVGHSFNGCAENFLQNRR